MVAHFCFLCAPGAGAPAQLPGFLTLGGSVGQGGRNGSADVRAVQGALNAVAPASGGPAPKLVVDGFVGQKTIAAIRRFQSSWTRVQDGRIDPRGPTLRALNHMVGYGVGRGLGTTTAGAPAAFGPTPGGGGVPALPGTDAAAEARALARLQYAQRIVLPLAVTAIVIAQRIISLAVIHTSRLGPGQAPPSPASPERLAFLFAAKHFRLHESRPVEAFIALSRINAVYARAFQAIARRTTTTPLGAWLEGLYSLAVVPPGGGAGIAYVGQLSGSDTPASPTGRMVPVPTPGGTTNLPEMTDGIYLLPGFDTLPLKHVMILIHEFAHLTGGPFPFGIRDIPLPDMRSYEAQPLEQRLVNVQNYEYFAAEAWHGSAGLTIINGVGAWGVWPPFSQGFGRIVPPSLMPGAPDPMAFPFGYPDGGMTGF